MRHNKRGYSRPILYIFKQAQKLLRRHELVFLNEHTDPRSYKVSFNRILSELEDYFTPEFDLDKGGKELVDYFNRVNFSEDDFRGRICNRLPQLRYLQQNKLIDKQLRYN